MYLQEKHKINVLFQQWLADEHASQYDVYLELDELNIDNIDKYQETLEKALYKLNVEYFNKRDSGRLKPLKVMLLKPGAGELFKRQKITKGQREGQFKSLCLIYKKDSDFPFNEHIAH